MAIQNKILEDQATEPVRIMKGQCIFIVVRSLLYLFYNQYHINGMELGKASPMHVCWDSKSESFTLLCINSGAGFIKQSFRWFRSSEMLETSTRHYYYSPLYVTWTRKAGTKKEILPWLVVLILQCSFGSVWNTLRWLQCSHFLLGQ